MGLKIGFAAEAAERGLYIKLKSDDKSKRGTDFAKVYFYNWRGMRFSFLVYLNGDIGFLHVSRELQLEVGFIVSGSPRPEDLPYLNGKEIPNELVFCEDYTSGVVSDMDLLPPAEHANNKERFSDPAGLWNEVIAGMVS